MENTFESISGNIVFVSGYRDNGELHDQDLFVLLLDCNRKIKDENDILFYGSKQMKPINSPNGYIEKVPISNDKSIIGPSDDSYICIADKIFKSLDIKGIDSIDDVCLIDLNKVDKDVKEILFVHVQYETLLSGNFPYVGNKNKILQNLIFKNSKSPSLLAKLTYNVNLKQIPFFISSKFERNSESSWNYKGTFEKVEDMNDFLESRLYKNENLERFISAQDYNNMFDIALHEIQTGHKMGHWIWYIFPQLKGLGQSTASHYYGLDDKEEALAYLHDRQLGYRLRVITNALLSHKSMDIVSIMGSKIDAIKLRSCMTLFDALSPKDVFGQALEAFFKGERDKLTIDKLYI